MKSWKARATCTAIVSCGLACGGFMDDVVLTGKSAVEPIGSVATVALPPSASNLRYVESTGIDWIINGQFSAARSEVEPWFSGLVLACDQPTAMAEVDERGLTFFRFHDDEQAWTVPRGKRWRVKRCENSGHSGPHYEVAMTMSGDPAWVWVSGVSF